MIAQVETAFMPRDGGEFGGPDRITVLDQAVSTGRRTVPVDFQGW